MEEYIAVFVQCHSEQPCLVFNQKAIKAFGKVFNCECLGPSTLFSGLAETLIVN